MGRKEQSPVAGSCTLLCRRSPESECSSNKPADTQTAIASILRGVLHFFIRSRVSSKNRCNVVHAGADWCNGSARRHRPWLPARPFEAPYCCPNPCTVRCRQSPRPMMYRLPGSSAKPFCSIFRRAPARLNCRSGTVGRERRCQADTTENPAAARWRKTTGARSVLRLRRHLARLSGGWL